MRLYACNDDKEAFRKLILKIGIHIILPTSEMTLNYKNVNYQFNALDVIHL